MERKYFKTGYGLKAQIAPLEDGKFCLTRYSYNTTEMGNKIVEQHIVREYEDAVAILKTIYGGDMYECDKEAFLQEFEIDSHEEVEEDVSDFLRLVEVIQFCGSSATNEEKVLEIKMAREDGILTDKEAFELAIHTFA